VGNDSPVRCGVRELNRELVGSRARSRRIEAYRAVRQRSPCVSSARHFDLRSIFTGVARMKAKINDGGGRVGSDAVDVVTDFVFEVV